jgi:hypothetical protein
MIFVLLPHSLITTGPDQSAGKWRQIETASYRVSIPPGWRATWSDEDMSILLTHPKRIASVSVSAHKFVRARDQRNYLDGVEKDLRLRDKSKSRYLHAAKVKNRDGLNIRVLRIHTSNTQKKAVVMTWIVVEGLRFVFDMIVTERAGSELALAATLTELMRRTCVSGRFLSEGRSTQKWVVPFKIGKDSA